RRGRPGAGPEARAPPRVVRESAADERVRGCAERSGRVRGGARGDAAAGDARACDAARPGVAAMSAGERDESGGVSRRQFVRRAAALAGAAPALSWAADGETRPSAEP